MTQPNSYRQILRSSAIIGGASAINIVIGLVKMKAVALLLGPAGVGIVRAGGGAVNVGLECLLVQLNAGRDVLAVDGDLIVAEVARHGHVFASADGDQVK